MLELCNRKPDKLACFSRVSRMFLAFCSRFARVGCHIWGQNAHGIPFVAQLWRDLTLKPLTRGFRFKMETRWRDLPANFFHCGAARNSFENGSRVARPPCQFLWLWRGANFHWKRNSCGATSLWDFSNNESVDSITNYLTKNQPIIYNNTTYISLTLTQIVSHINPLSSRKNRYVSKNVPFCDQNGNEVARPPCQTFHLRISIVKGYTVAQPPCNNFRTA